jgi:predicted dehydrogenase
MKGLVVGGGSIGRRHAQNLRTLGVDPVLLVEPDIHRRRVLSQDRAWTLLDTLEEGLALNPDFAVIAGPTQHHVPQALEAARGGCHLFIEKPLSYSRDHLDHLCQEIERRPLVSLVACNMRFHPGPAKVKRLIEEGGIGDVIAARIQTGSYLPRWRADQDYHRSYSASPEWGGTILDCIHEIDLALWYFGPAKLLAAVHRPGRTIDLKTDGLAEIILEHEGGALCSVHLNFIQRDYRRTCQVIGTEGTLYWDFEDGNVTVYGPTGKEKATYPEPEGWQMNQMYVDELQHFLRAIRNKSQTVNTVRESLATLEIALVARKMGQG